MSTDFSVACHTCRVVMHLGQRMADTYSFGFGSSDEDGAAIVAFYIHEHLSHDLRIHECEDPAIDGLDDVTDYDDSGHTEGVDQTMKIPNSDPSPTLEQRVMKLEIQMGAIADWISDTVDRGECPLSLVEKKVLAALGHIQKGYPS